MTQLQKHCIQSKEVGVIGNWCLGHFILYYVAPQSPPPNVNSARKSPTTSSVEWDGIRWEDLRGWLVDYEIGYGSEMMSHAHQQCPANDSTYTEILSVDSGGEHELTGLDPGLQYCVRLAGRTSAGVGPFSHTLIPCTSFFSCYTITVCRNKISLMQ